MFDKKRSKILMLLLLFFFQQAFSSTLIKNEKPDIYLVAPVDNMMACIDGACKTNKLNSSDFSVIKATIAQLSDSICTASNNVTKYAFTINVNAGVVILGASSGITIEVQCKNS